MEQEIFIKIKENFGIFIFITPQPYWEVKFIIKKGLIKIKNFIYY